MAQWLADGIHARPACLVADAYGADVELLRRIAGFDPTIRVVFAAADADIRLIVRVMRGGAVDYLQKPLCGVALLDAVSRAVILSGTDRAVLYRRSQAQERLDRLTPRERRVLVEVLEGRLNKQIAATLDCQEATIKVHRSRLMRKLGVSSLARLVHFVRDVEVDVVDEPRLA